MEGNMRALVIDDYTGNIVIKEIPIPTLASGQVLIKVEVAPIHQIDLDYCKGNFYHKKALPNVPGFEGAGLVIKGTGGVNA